MPLIVWVYHSIFSQMFLVGSVKRIFSARVRISRPRSSKVINCGTNWRTYTTSYRSVIVTLVLSCIVWEILQVILHPTLIPP